MTAHDETKAAEEKVGDAPKEHNIRLNQRLPLPLSPPLVPLLFLTTLLLPLLLIALLRLLPRRLRLLPFLPRLLLRFEKGEFGRAEGAEGDAGGEDVFFDGGAGETGVAEEAGGGGEGAWWMCGVRRDARREGKAGRGKERHESRDERGKERKRTVAVQHLLNSNQLEQAVNVLCCGRTKDDQSWRLYKKLRVSKERDAL